MVLSPLLGQSGLGKDVLHTMRWPEAKYITRATFGVVITSAETDGLI